MPQPVIAPEHPCRELTCKIRPVFFQRTPEEFLRSPPALSVLQGTLDGTPVVMCKTVIHILPAPFLLIVAPLPGHTETSLTDFTREGLN